MVSLDHASLRVMNVRSKQSFIEWGFIGFLFVLCVTLTSLQYYWTGEVSRAQETRLRAGLGEQARAITQAFDAELAESCLQLRPTASDLERRGREAAHIARLQEWKSGEPRPLFHRIAVVVPSRDGIELFGIDQKSEKLVPMAWPTEWATLKENLTLKHARGSPPFSDRTGALLEFPVFGAREAGGPSESEWFLLELDLSYVRSVWLPELVRSHLILGDKPIYDVTITDGDSPGALLFASRTEATQNRETALAIRFHRQGRASENSRRHAGLEKGVWTLEARHRPGALEALVAASRWRNLAVAGLMNTLIMAAGLALVFYTRRSRELADSQMTFVATVSHELRTPLTVIRGAGHNLLHGIARERNQIEQYSQLIIQHADQLTEMVEQILSLAGTVKGLPASARHSVALAAVLSDAVAATAADTLAAGCEVHLDLPSSLPEVFADDAALRRVFQNLINNAAKHGGAGGWIGIRARWVNTSVPPMVEICVTDRGCGIPTHEWGDIFKPFFRGANAEEQQIRGSGLGLSLVKEIVEAHGGKVSVLNQPGGGVSFSVQLPIITHHRLK